MVERVIDYRISVGDVRVIDASGQNLGQMLRDDAIALAKEQGLTLLLVGQGAIPVCKIVDLGKLKYEDKKKNRSPKNKVLLKELKMAIGIDDEDLKRKVKQAQQFMAEGHKVRFTVQLRGREQAHPELIKPFFQRVAPMFGADVKLPEPKQEGRAWSITI